MEIKFAQEDGRLAISFIGDLDNAAVSEAEKLLNRVFTQEEFDILIDCSQLNYIASKGLRMLINLYKHQRENDLQCFITQMNPHVKNVLNTGGFLTIYQEIE
jgi:anti-anti-sigma factor